MVSCSQAAKFVPDVLALSIPLTFPFCHMPLLLMPLHLPLPKMLSTCCLVMASESSRRFLLVLGRIPYIRVVVECFGV